jgi:acetoin:2,6-dichlorophenolindophenol oxidoreductase subunit alpha
VRYQYAGEGDAGWQRRLARYPGPASVALFREMLRIRRIEEEVERRYHQDQMATPIHLVIGQEATSVGACAALERRDLVYASHRTHGNYLAKGGNLKGMLAEMHCRATGCAGSRGGSMHLIDKSVGMAGTSAIVAGIVPVAVGAALAAKMQRREHVIMVFFGDGATEEGALAESLNAAILWKLPIVFFCENNFYSVQSPLTTRQPVQRSITRWAEGFGLPAECVDGTNVFDVYDASQRAVDRARFGGGPTFIEAPVYRFRAHGGSGDDSKTGYRAVDERELWERVCPVEAMQRALMQAEVLDSPQLAAMEQEIAQEIEEAFAFALASPVPTEADLYRHVYAE